MKDVVKPSHLVDLGACGAKVAIMLSVKTVGPSSEPPDPVLRKEQQNSAVDPVKSQGDWSGISHMSVPYAEGDLYQGHLTADIAFLVGQLSARYAVK